MICRHVGRVLPGFDRFQIEESYGKVFLRWKARWTDKTFGAHLTSDGSLRFFALTTLLNLPPEMLPDVLLLDEPELGLHPSAVALVGDMIKALSNERQVIVRRSRLCSSMRSVSMTSSCWSYGTGVRRFSSSTRTSISTGWQNIQRESSGRRTFLVDVRDPSRHIGGGSNRRGVRQVRSCGPPKADRGRAHTDPARWRRQRGPTHEAHGRLLLEFRLRYFTCRLLWV